MEYLANDELMNYQKDKVEGFGITSGNKKDCENYYSKTFSGDFFLIQ